MTDGQKGVLYLVALVVMWGIILGGERAEGRSSPSIDPPPQRMHAVTWHLPDGPTDDRAIMTVWDIELNEWAPIAFERAVESPFMPEGTMRGVVHFPSRSERGDVEVKAWMFYNGRSALMSEPATLTQSALHYVPEPSRLTLLGFGVAVLAIGSLGKILWDGRGR